jgi:drug/metabolite transporter (DMT)-like permease
MSAMRSLEIIAEPRRRFRRRRGRRGLGGLVHAGRRTLAGQAGPEHLALLAAGVTVMLWASAFVAIRGAGRQFSPGALALGRLACGSVVLGAVALIRREGWPPRAAWPGIVAAGLLWFGVYMVALNWGEQKVDAGTAAMVVNVGPVIIALLSGWLLREGFPRWLLPGVAVSFAGVIVAGIATSGTGHVPVTGVLLCLLAAVSYSAAVICQKPALRHASAVQVTTFSAALGALACLPFTGQLISQVSRAPMSATLSVCYLGVFPTAVAFTTWAYALARTPAGKMGATTYLVPALTVLMSWAILGQLPGWLADVGGVLCLAGVAISRRPSRRSADRATRRQEHRPPAVQASQQTSDRRPQ